MLVRGSMALAIVTAGIGLGALLGAAADPAMKQPPAQPQRAALQAPYTADVGYPAVAWPTDVSLYRDSYAPSWADEELADWEPDYPAWTYSGLVDEGVAAPIAVDKVSVDEQPGLEAESLAPSEDLAVPSEPEVLPPEPQVAGNLAALY